MLPGLDKVIINGIEFAVIAKEFDDDEGLMGDCDLQTAEIHIDPRAALRMQKRTLFHEVLHLIIFMAGYGEEDVKEGVIVALENGIPNVLRDNPQLALLLAGTHSIEEDEYAQQIMDKLLDSGAAAVLDSPLDSM